MSQCQAYNFRTSAIYGGFPVEAVCNGVRGGLTDDGGEFPVRFPSVHVGTHGQWWPTVKKCLLETIEPLLSVAFDYHRIHTTQFQTFDRL